MTEKKKYSLSACREMLKLLAGAGVVLLGAQWTASRALAIDYLEPVPAAESLTASCTSEQVSILNTHSKLRQQLKEVLGIPSDRVPLAAEKRGEVEHDGIVIERWVFTSEPGSRVPALLYRPRSSSAPMPALVLTYGHGGSKSHWYCSYAGQLYAKLGLAVLAIDPLGEEERCAGGSVRLGTREHDKVEIDRRAREAGRLIMGKLVFDTMRGVDFLLERTDIDKERLGVAGNSLGGATAGWMAALEPRIKLALVSGWAYGDDVMKDDVKSCQRIPNQRMRELCSWSDFATLGAPHCTFRFMNGDADEIIDRNRDGAAWSGTRNTVVEAKPVYRLLGSDEGIDCWFEAGGGHRPYFLYKEAIKTIHQCLGTPGWSRQQIDELVEINSGRWCDAHGIKLEKRYGTEHHQRGARLPDLQIKPASPADMRCLKPTELGSPDFTFEGWLTTVEAEAATTTTKAIR